MDAYAIVNKNKTEYNSDGGYFVKVRFNKQITEELFKEVSIIIADYFKDNYDENIKTYYKTGSETNGKRYTATYPIANTKFIQEDL
jgi:predicted membrane-bound dolichyl-phosphate-mannose-protein mannosyltransferase